MNGEVQGFACYVEVCGVAPPERVNRPVTDFRRRESVGERAVLIDVDIPLFLSAAARIG